MEKETPLAKNLDVAGQNARYDQVCKRLMSYKNVLAWILKECVREYRDCDVKDIAEKYIEGTPQISTMAVHPDEGAITGTNTEDNQVGDVREKEANYDLLNMTMICLGRPGQKTYNRVLRLLEVLLSSEMPPNEKKEILQSEFAMKMVEQMEGDVTEMCNLSQGVEQRGIEKGMERGLARGRQEGIRQAARELAAAGVPAKKIAEVLHLSEKEITES